MILRLTGATAGSITFDGRDVSGFDRGDLRRYYSHVQGVFQDPFSSYNPVFKVDRVLGHDPFELPSRPERGRVEDPAAQVARGRVARAGGRPRQVPAPAERWPAPAADDRARARPRHPVPRRRRDHQHARCLDPDRRAQPARRPEGAGRRHPLHHARPLARQLHLRQDPDPAPRPDRRVRADAEGVRQSRAIPTRARSSPRCHSCTGAGRPRRRRPGRPSRPFRPVPTARAGSSRSTRGISSPSTQRRYRREPNRAPALQRSGRVRGRLRGRARDDRRLRLRGGRALRSLRASGGGGAGAPRRQRPRGLRPPRGAHPGGGRAREPRGRSSACSGPTGSS